MSNNEFSPHWYRVAKLKPRFHSHIEIHRHHYRGLIWYILEDTNTGRNQRFNPVAYQFIGLLDGKLTVQEIYDALSQHLGDYAPGQEDIVQLLGKLHQADLIQTEALVNTEELFERQVRLNRSKLNQRLLNPVSQRVPLWDPEDFLNKHLNKVAWLFSGWFGIIWLLVVGFAGLQAAANWSRITHHFDINAFAPYNLLIAFLLYPLVKILHELGHAFAMKLKGGEVHEMGINFMMFMPVPYVNVSSASHLRSKYDRILISAAGILVETFLAALGLFVFLSAEAGIVQDIAFNIVLTAGASSLFFNGNPLMKYDGYYILADALGIHNLYQRASQFWTYFFQHYLFGIKQAVSPATAPGETVWFVTYSIASLLYRLSILWFICVYVTEKFFSLGVLLALWMVTLQVLLPIFKGLRFVVTSPSLGHKRNKAALTTMVLAITGLGLFGFMPIPSYTLAEGVVWLPDEAQIKAEQDGFIGTCKFNPISMFRQATMCFICLMTRWTQKPKWPGQN
jgi:putative peptide zinc metalloprotease protein